MNLQIKDELIPGTKLLRSEMGGVTGLEFLNGSLWVSYAALAVMTFMTIYSGIQYFVLYLPALKDKKD